MIVSFHRVTRALGIASVVMGALALLGWVTGLRRLASIEPSFIPMSPNAAVAFVLQGVGLIVVGTGAPRKRVAAAVLAILPAVVIGLSLLTVADATGLLHMGVDQVVLRIHERHAGVPFGVMSPITAGTFAVQAAGLLVLTSTRWRHAAQVAALMATASAWVGAAVVLGYVYQTPLFAGGSIIPIALTTGIAFLASGIGLVIAAGPDTWPLRSLGGASVRAVLMRWFLPLTVAILTLGGLLSVYAIGLKAQNPALVTAVVASTAAALAALVVERIAAQIGAAIESVERERRASEERYRTLFDASSDGIFIADIETRALRYANPAASRMLGYAASDLVTMRVADLHPKEALPHVLAEFEALTRKERVVAPDIPCLRKDGTIVYADISAGWVTIDGTPCTAGFFRDVTDRRRAQAERDKLAEQLKTSQKMEAIGSLAGGVAHDFNNLLSVILSCTVFALDSLKDGDPIREDLLEVQRAGERAAALTRQLLAFGRRQVVQPEPLDLNEIAMGTESLLKRVIGAQVELVQVHPPDIDLVIADQGQLEQIIMNLAINARDAMPEGGTLTIETANVEVDKDSVPMDLAMPPGRYVRLSITDTGRGMDAATRARLFEPFFTTKEGGTGLGLATVYGIVKQTGGGIGVRTEVGVGTTFAIYLPRAEPPSEALVEPSPPSPPVAGTETVLVVEDEDAVRRVTERILREAGHLVISAANGAEALAIIEAHEREIQIMVTDVVMPGMSGIVLAERLAVIRPEVRVLFMSGYTGIGSAHEAVLDGNRSFIAKPFSAEDLVRKVRAVLDES